MHKRGTGNSVKIDAAMTPESTNHEGEKTCRLVSVVLSAKGQSMNLRPRFCGYGPNGLDIATALNFRGR
jgi:hypothetical protein